MAIRLRPLEQLTTRPDLPASRITRQSVAQLLFGSSSHGGPAPAALGNPVRVEPKRFPGPRLTPLVGRARLLALDHLAWVPFTFSEELHSSQSSKRKRLAAVCRAVRNA